MTFALSQDLQQGERAPLLQQHAREAQIVFFRAKAEEIRAVAAAMTFIHSRRMLLGLARTYDQLADTISRIRRPED